MFIDRFMSPYPDMEIVGSQKLTICDKILFGLRTTNESILVLNQGHDA